MHTNKDHTHAYTKTHTHIKKSHARIHKIYTHEYTQKTLPSPCFDKGHKIRDRVLREVRGVDRARHF